jgi:hypothetical protein
MRRRARLVIVIKFLVGAAVFLCCVGCEGNGDGTGPGPNPPPVSYLPQTFSLAVADGSASADGFAHSGIAVVTLDWDNEAPGPNAVAPAYMYEYVEGYPVVDGSLSNDSGTWDKAPETVLNLGDVYGGGGVNTVRIKSVYTDVNPPRIWFLLRWDDPADTGQENSGYWGHRWEVVSKEGGATDWWDTRFDLNEDWVAFMWDTWDCYFPDDDPKGKDFEPRTDGFQDEGCTVTCHSGDPDHPHHTNGDDEVCDLWIWTGTRTNYTADQTNWGGGIDDPAFMFDCNVDDRGFRWGTGDAFPEEEWLTFDEGTSPYVDNYNGAGYPDYGSINDPGANWKYLWYSDESIRDIGIVGEDVILPTDERWNIGDRVAGYIHRTALGGCADVLGRGCWKDGVWTIEVERNIGIDYEDIYNDEDVFLGIQE